MKEWVCVCVPVWKKKGAGELLFQTICTWFFPYSLHMMYSAQREGKGLYFYLSFPLYFTKPLLLLLPFFYIFLINLLRVFLLYNFFFKDPISPSCVPDFEFLPRLLLDPPFVNLHQVAIIIQLPCKVSNSFFLLEKLVWPHTQNLFGYERKTKGEEGGGGGKSRNGLKIALWRVE